MEEGANFLKRRVPEDSDSGKT
ncbi:hypothetical protein CLS_10450 [[Clostridium] cf. saccharolyticum K10]|nr:hypothetical protein CLS_10450 [[Clostridium] cf. saccharolyticum K10]